IARPELESGVLGDVGQDDDPCQRKPISGPRARGLHQMRHPNGRPRPNQPRAKGEEEVAPAGVGHGVSRVPAARTLSGRWAHVTSVLENVATWGRTAKVRQARSGGGASWKNRSSPRRHGGHGEKLRSVVEDRGRTTEVRAFC